MKLVQIQAPAISGSSSGGGGGIIIFILLVGLCFAGYFFFKYAEQTDDTKQN